MLGLTLEALARSTGSWVATPTGQVLRWHLRIMMQPGRNQWGGCKAELVSTQEGANDDVAASPDSAVDLHGNAATQAG